MATAALASGPVLIDAVIRYGLHGTLTGVNRDENKILVSARKPANQVEYQESDLVVQQFLEQHFGGSLTKIIPSGNLGLMYPWQGESVVVNHRITLGYFFNNKQEIKQNLSLVSGDFPDNYWPTPKTIAVAIGPGLADEFDLQVGDQLPVSLSVQTSSPELWLSIAAILDVNPSNIGILANDFGVFKQIQVSDETINYGALVDQDTFFRLAPELFSSLGAFYTWQADLPLDKINVDNLSLWQTRLNTFPQEAQQIDSDLSVQVDLEKTLNTFADQTNLVRTTLTFLNGIIVLVSLYYIVMMANLSLDRVQTEFSILRSRGASSTQILRFQLLEAIVISILGAASGPLLAWVFVRGLSLWGPLSKVAKPDWGLSLSQAAWLAGSVALIGSVASFLLPLPARLRTSIITQKQLETRITKPPLWQRLYIDVFTLIIGIVLVWRVQLYGGLLGIVGSYQSDYLLLLAPLILLAGSAAILLRIFPAALRWGTNMVSNSPGFISVFAFWQVARNPKNISRLVLLLMLAMSLGLFSSSLNLVLRQNESDRARYFVGSDYRIVSSKNSPIESKLDLPSRVSDVWRTQGTIDFGNTFPELDILAIDPPSFNSIAYYRPDFAREPVENLLIEMKTYWEANDIPVPGLPLPGEPGEVGLWLSLPYILENSPNDYVVLENVYFEARLISSLGENVTVSMLFSGQTGGPENDWFYFAGSVPDLGPDSYPINLISIWFRNGGFRLEPREIISIDDITVYDRTGTGPQVIDSFDESGFSGWVSVSPPLRAFPIASNPRTGTSSMALTFESSNMSPTRLYGISRVDDAPVFPIPALMSPAFKERSSLFPGDRVTIKVRGTSAADWTEFLFIMVDTVDYFPTMYDTEEAGYLVTLKQPIFDQLNLYRSIPIQANERFISIDNIDPENPDQSLMEYPGLVIHSYTSMLEAYKAQPLALGLRSGATFGFLLTTILSLVGFGFNFYLNTSQRTITYGVLRALGLSTWQLYSSLLLEQVLLVVSGLTLGTLLGIGLNQLTLPGLPLRLGEMANIPPTIPKTDWQAVTSLYLTLAVAFLISIGIGTFFLWRTEIHRVVRIGEE
ncbi:MAG: FtsX-like permease family protein [Anaerolineales bacterium]|nr:MAG: FtsX-like permease family protein [Anaerolineales bacterium]